MYLYKFRVRSHRLFPRPDPLPRPRSTRLTRAITVTVVTADPGPRNVTVAFA